MKRVALLLGMAYVAAFSFAVGAQQGDGPQYRDGAARATSRSTCGPERAIASARAGLLQTGLANDVPVLECP